MHGGGEGPETHHQHCDRVIYHLSDSTLYPGHAFPTPAPQKRLQDTFSIMSPARISCETYLLILKLQDYGEIEPLVLSGVIYGMPYFEA